MLKNSIFFVHIPRTAGGTFSYMLSHAYESFYRYSITEKHRYSQVSNLARVVSGHFTYHPNYKNDYFLATFLRHPVDHTISYWLYIAKEQPIESFLETFPYYNMQTDFIKGHRDPIGSLQDFDFIGITEKFDKSIELFQEMAPRPDREFPEPIRKNATDKTNIIISDSIRAEIEKRNFKDMALYDNALKRFGRDRSRYLL
jgi:hypothetical protein